MKINWLKQILNKISPELKFILVLFVLTRLVLTLVGLTARIEIQPEVVPRYLTQPYADVWAVWDAGWYLNIAEHGYSAEPIWQQQANYAFFPVYPLATRWLGSLLGNIPAAGLILSNLALIVVAWYLYQLTKLKFSENLAKWSVVWLFLFPISFVFSGLLTESLFLALLLAVFYYAEKGSWARVGTLGFFLALTRSLGVVTVLPLLLIYLNQIGWHWKKITSQVLWLVFIPLGLFLFMAFNEWLTGSWLAFVTIQRAWHHFTANPIITLYKGLVVGNQYWLANSIFTLTIIGLLVVFWKKIKAPYLVLSGLLIVIPLASSITSLNSLSRYLTVVFPIFWGLAFMSENKIARWSLLIIGGLLQIFLMAGWTRSGFWVV